MLLLRIKGTRKSIIQSKGARQAKTEDSPMLLTTEELATPNMCDIMKSWTNLRPTKPCLLFFLYVTVSCQQRTSYIDHSLYIPTRKTYSSLCFCAFLILLLVKLFLSSIPCHSSGMKWMVLLPFAAVELFLCLSRSELQGHGLSFGKLCFLHSQYLLEDDKSILPTGCKGCGSHTVWNALGNWSQSCFRALKGSTKPCIRLSCQWGTSEEKKDRLSCSLWSVSLGRWAAVIWNSHKCDLNAAESWLQFQSLPGFSLQSYIKARWCEAGKKSMDNNECRNRGPNLSWQLLHISWDILSPVFRLLCRQSIKINTEEREFFF